MQTVDYGLALSADAICGGLWWPVEVLGRPAGVQ